jgi:hypothetical protein
MARHTLLEAQRGRPLDARTVSELQALHRNGHAIKALARVYNLDRWTVRKYVRRAAHLPVQPA